MDAISSNWIAVLIGGGVIGTLANILLHWLGVYTSARTDFQDNLMARVNKLEGKVEHLREENRDFKQENRQLKAMLYHLLQDHNTLRKEQGLDPIDFDSIRTQFPFGQPADSEWSG